MKIKIHLRKTPNLVNIYLQVNDEKKKKTLF